MEKIIVGRWRSKCKGPEASWPVYVRSNKKISMAGAEGGSGKSIG